jgi:hypothetical protein
VHAFDDQSLTETLQGQQYVVKSARQFANGRQLHVSPVTFKMRFNPNATGPEPEPQPGELPPTVDPRQMSLYGAAWTLGSIKFLSEAGADLITCYETVGPRGLIQGSRDSAFMKYFPAEKEMVFPLWQILKWVLEFKKGNIIPIKSPKPLVINGLLLEQNGRQRLIAANYTLRSQNLILDEMAKSMAILDEHSAALLLRNPHALQPVSCNQQSIELLPYAIACIDF